MIINLVGCQWFYMDFVDNGDNKWLATKYWRKKNSFSSNHEFKKWTYEQ